MLSEKLPKLSQHFTTHSVDPALFTLNWFLCVFVDTMPVKTYLHIWDAFLFEGSKVCMYFFYLDLEGYLKKVTHSVRKFSCITRFFSNGLRLFFDHPLRYKIGVWCMFHIFSKKRFMGIKIHRFYIKGT